MQNNKAAPASSGRLFLEVLEFISLEDQQNRPTKQPNTATDSQNVGHVLNWKTLELRKQGRPCVAALISALGQSLHSSSGLVVGPPPAQCFHGRRCCRCSF